MHIDLHTHTSISDGLLSPSELINRAVDKNIRLLSITDHDSIAAYQLLEKSYPSLKVIPGIELSSVWNRIGIHVVGLNIDLDSKALAEAMKFQNNARALRAGSIAEKLEKMGIQNPLKNASQIANNNNIGRPHFARYLVQAGICRNFNEAFNKYLSNKNLGNLNRFWPDLPRTIEWIRSANGFAILAHPLKYDLTRTRLGNLTDDFIKAGGQGIEVISGRQLPTDTRQLARLCNKYKLLASCGSDFHEPGQTWADLGNYPPLPRDCEPVWDRF